MADEVASDFAQKVLRDLEGSIPEGVAVTVVVHANSRLSCGSNATVEDTSRMLSEALAMPVFEDHVKVVKKVARQPLSADKQIHIECSSLLPPSFAQFSSVKEKTSWCGLDLGAGDIGLAYATEANLADTVKWIAESGGSTSPLCKKCAEKRHEFVMTTTG